MGGGLMQLVAYGAQDIYLTGNPQITFFKVVYRRHTNFSMEAISQTWNGTVGLGNRVTATISRNGDLISKMYLELNLTPENTTHLKGIGTTGGEHNIGYSCIKEVTLEIGGQQIDKHTGLWMTVYDQLTNDQYVDAPSHETDGTTNVLTAATALESNVGYAVNSYQSMIGGYVSLTASTKKLLLPFHFWFCRNPGLALPLIALQYHEVKVNLDFEVGGNVDGTTPTALSSTLWVDYIYLDTDERRRFAQVSHEYLIEQVQFDTKGGAASGTDVKATLNFNHPVKELIWCSPIGTTEPCSLLPLADAIGSQTSGGSVGAAHVGKGQLKLNGHDRFAEREMSYFTRCQTQQFHTNSPPQSRIGVYSFALKPEEHQPSGTCNFSRIDNAELTLNTGGGTTIPTWYIFAVNYNVLRIMSGMGGLAYSN